MNKLSLVILLLTLCTISKAQQSLTDSIFELKAVAITKIQTNDNNIGAHTSQINSTILESGITQSIGTLLSDNSLIYIKSMGQGGMATSSFRGTSSNHTQVNWNGININPISNGSFDFSQIPTFFVDEVSLYHGSNYLKNGTGALGGSINLTNTHNFTIWDKTGLHGRALGELGSNGTYTGGLMTSYTNSKIHSKTRLYYQQSDNNFKYEYSFRPGTTTTQRRKNADYDQWGVMQEVQYKISKENNLSANVWFTDNRNNLPQPIFVQEEDFDSYSERQRVKNLRSVIKYNGKNNKSDYSFSAAYLFSDYKYRLWQPKMSNDAFSKNKAHTIIGKGDYNYQLNPGLSIGGAFSYRYDLLHIDNLSKRDTSNYLVLSSKHRNTVTLQANLLWQISRPLAFNMQVMTEQNDDKFMPTFSAGINYELIKDRLYIQSSTAYNYHYPTLNDHYWIPGGNEDLRPEKGFSYDATINYMTDIDKPFYFKGSVTYYITTVRDWILWIRRGSFIASPENIHKVLAHGAEIMTETSLHTGSLWHRLFFNYAYSSTEKQSGSERFEGDFSTHKQLPYIPIHKFNARYILRLQNFMFGYGMAYTGKRYTSTDQQNSTPSYLIHDTEISYNLRFKQNKSLQLKVRVDNLFDEFYESTEYYPLPLRSWYVSAQFSF